jgi:hypothetical protein
VEEPPPVSYAAGGPEPHPTRAGLREEPAPAGRRSSRRSPSWYLKQGLVRRARSTSIGSCCEDPANDRARSRLAEIEQVPSPAAARAARRRELERTIAGLEALLAVVQRR